jgi:hypothetical protein
VDFEIRLLGKKLLGDGRLDLLPPGMVDPLVGLSERGNSLADLCGRHQHAG